MPDASAGDSPVNAGKDSSEETGSDCKNISESRSTQGSSAEPPLDELDPRTIVTGPRVYSADDLDLEQGIDSNPAVSGPPWPTLVGYEILSELGRGGMGIVYKARQSTLNRLVAIKVIVAGCQASPGDLARFRREAQAVAHLQHPNIIQIFEVGNTNGLPYLVLELLEGGTLRERLHGNRMLPPEAARVTEILARAIHAAHQRGIVHRDLKPANVLLSADGTPKITDFGLAKRLDTHSGHTKTGDILGTPSYMAPEQARGMTRDIGPTTDVYALGATLYELLTGQSPFRAETAVDTILKVVSEQPIPPRVIQPAVPRALEAICLKCLEKAQSKRYASANELAEDLARWLTGQPIKAQRGSDNIGRNRLGMSGVAIFLALVVAGIVGVLMIDRRAPVKADPDQSRAPEVADLAGQSVAIPVRNDQSKIEEPVQIRGPNKISETAEMLAHREALSKPAQSLRVTKVYFGVEVCVNCHSKKNPSELRPPPVLCRCNEVLTWEKGDKHKDAYKNLLDPRGQQMLKLLDIEDVSKEQRCVSCHGVYVPPDKLKVLTDPTFKPEDGVSCIACHGPYGEWVTLHGSALQRDRDKWRSLSRRAKEEQYGMTDLWDPAKRTRMCSSCHIGNTHEGKVVTHAMYAAGHPPLPSVEIATFSDQMPRHWLYLKEKNEQAQKILAYDPAQLERIKLVVVGAAAVFQTAMELLASQAEMAERASNPENQFLDLAQFDCYACHKRFSLSKERRHPAAPTRFPQFKPWPMALIKIGVQHAGQDQDASQLAQKLNELHKAFDIEPFGKLDQIASAAIDLASWGQQLTDKLNSAGTKYEQANVPGLLQHLCARAASETPDYDTARQMAWAFGVIYSEWTPRPVNDDKILEKLKALDDHLKLNLPSGREQHILAQLPLALTRISDYDPSRFRQTFAELANLLPPK